MGRILSISRDWKGNSNPGFEIFPMKAYEDYLDDVLSLELPPEGGGDSLHSTNMFDFLVKEEPLGEEDIRALQKDRQKKDNHNMSKEIKYRIYKKQTFGIFRTFAKL